MSKTNLRNDKNFYKKHLESCAEDISKQKWKEKNYNELIGYCNLIIADFKKIQKINLLLREQK